MSDAIITEDMMVGAAPQTSTPSPPGTSVPAAPEPVITESQMTGGFDPHMVTEGMMTGPAPLHTPGLGGPTGSPLISGFAKGFGSEPLSWSGGLSELLSSTGMTPPNGPGTGTTMQGINQMIEPVLGAGATMAELGYRGLSGLLGAGQATVAQVGEDVGQPGLGRDVAAIPEAFPTGFNLGIPRQPTGGIVPYRPAEAAPSASDVFARGAEGIPRQPERPVPAGPDAPFHEPTAPEATQPAPAVTPAPVQPTQPVAPEPMEPPILRPKPAQPIAPVPEPSQVSPATQAPEPPPNAHGPDSPGYVPPVAPGPPSVGGSGNAPDPAGQPGQPVVGQPSPAPGGADGAGPVTPVAPEPVPGPAPVAGQPTPEPPPGVDANAAPPAVGNGGTGAEGAINPPSPARSVPGPDDTPVAPGPDPARTAPAGAGPAGEPGQARTETVSTATGRKVDTQFEVVDAASLKQATGNLQNRDRQGRSSSDAQIANIAGNLDPNRLHSSPEADRGAPIVGPDHVIESGNGRVAAIRQAYAAGKGDPYRQMIQQQGHTIPPGVSQPVLIRRRTTPMDDATRQAFTREANTPATMQLSAGEEARSDAAALSPETLGRLNPHLTGGVLAAGNRDFVRSWLSGLSEGERNRLQSEDGSGLSQDGVKRLQSAIIAKAYGDPAVVRRLTESTDDATKAISGALTDVAPLMATVRAKIEAGQLPKELDISKQIMRAADLARVSREKGQSPNDILNSGDMFNPIDRTTGALVRAFHDPKMTRLAGRARVADILKRYAQEALKQTSNDLAGGSKLDPAQYINAAINKAAPETEAQSGLFGQPQPRTEPEPAAGVSSESAQPVAGGAGEGSGSSRSPASTPERTGTRTDTPEFRRWFGESKVTAPDGAPKRMYHGTTTWTRNGLEFGNIQAFNRNAAITYVGRRPGMDMIGSWFTDETGDPSDPEHGANLYAAGGDKGAIYPVYLSIKNPLVVRPQGGKIAFDVLADMWNAWHADHMAALRKSRKKADKAELESLEKLKRPGNPGVWGNPDGFQAHLKTQGYDGVRFEPFQESPTAKPQDGWIAFDPEQIKSAIGNKGTWDPANVDIAADRMSELAPPGFNPTVQGNISRNTHHTMRPSHYMRQVAEEAGVADPDAFVSLPAPVQVRRLSHALTDKYDLGKITIHPGSNPRLILDQLADAHHNLQSMAAVMGVPNNTIGFGGELNLWLGPTTAKEAEGVYGAYVPATGTIIMPGRSNSFAHEWTHALDTELVRRLSASPRVGELLSTHYPTTLARAQQGPVAAFGHLMGTIYGGPGNARAALDYLQATRQAAIQPTPTNQRALAAARQKFQASDFYRRAAGAGGVRGTYLSQPYELLARSHEAYMATRISEAGGSTEFVAKSETAYLHQVDQDFRSMFPQGDERQAIFQAWDGVHSALRQAILYPKGIPADVATSNDLFGLGPSHWAQWANPAANPALTATLKQELNRQMVQRGWWEEMRERGGLTQNQTDPGYMTWTARKIDAVRIISHSPRGEMNAIHKILTKKAPNAAPHIRSLIDHLTTDPGSGRLVPETYEEEFHRLNHRDLNDYAALVERHGIATSPESNWNPKGLARKATSLPRMVPSEIDALHELMTGATSIRGLPENIQEALRTHTINRLSAADKAALDAHWDRADATRAPGATPRIRRFASSLRHYLDKKYYELGQAGIQIPYTDGYWPKVFDEARIRTQPAAFRDDAAEVKAIQSRRDIGDKGEALVERFRALRGTPTNPGPTDPNGTPYLNPQDGDDINRAIAQARRTLQPGQPVRPEDLVPDPDHRALIHEAWGKQAADSWLTNITVGHPTSFETHGPAGGHLQARTLPPESDDILRRWIIKDPHSMMPAYTSQINRRIAYVKRFGPGGHKIEDALRAASRAGMDRDQLDTVRHLAEQITGRNHRSPSFATVRNMSSAIHAWTVMSLLGRASFTALHEPMVALLRTQNVRDTAMGFLQMAREIARTGEAKRIAELAEHIGLTTSPVFESIVQHRMGTGPADSVALNALTTNFFRRILMSQITNAQRRGGLAQGHSYLRRMSDQLLDQDVRDIQRRRAARALTELGIPAAEHQDFARWIQAHPRTQAPGIPDIQDHRNGELWASAIYRFTNQVNQAPTTSEKPIMSDDPYGKMVFGLLNFNYSFQANVLDRALAEAEADFHDAKGFAGKTASAARSAAHNFRGAAGLVFASFLGTALVHSLFNGASWDEHEKKGDLYEWLMNAAMQRSGLSGTMDPLVQLYHGLRYQKSVGDLGLGIGGFWADNINAVLDGFARSSPHTNTSSYNAYKGVYNLGVVPALTWLMTALPGGRIASPLATTALMKGTSRSAADTFATSIVGEKGSGDETTAPQTEAPERDPDEDEKKPDTGSKEGLLLGFADDFLPLAGRMLGALPAPLKWGAAGLGVLWGGHKLYEDAQRYTEPPPGKAER